MLTNKQTNADENITSLAEVTNVYLQQANGLQPSPPRIQQYSGRLYLSA